MKIERIGLILVIGLISCSVASPTCAEEPIQPVFSQYMEELDVWKGQWDFFRSAKGELVLVGDGGPEGSGIASDDEGRTWHDWPDIHSWPKGGIQVIMRRNDDLFIQGSDMRIWCSPDEGRTWLGGNRLLMWPNQVNKKLLWYTPGDRIVATKEGRLVNASVVESVRQRFAAQGVSEDQLIMEGFSPRPELLAAYNRVDIALNPFPYPGGTISLEGLWMGVPVITRQGNRFLSRVGESIAQNAGLADWIAHDNDDYVAKAVAHASNLEGLAQLRSTLRQQVLTSPLFDAPRFSAHFETALWGMWQRFSDADFTGDKKSEIAAMVIKIGCKRAGNGHFPS